MDIKDLIDSIEGHALDIKELAVEGRACGGKDDAVRYGGIHDLARLILEEAERLRRRAEGAGAEELLRFAF